MTKQNKSSLFTGILFGVFFCAVGYAYTALADSSKETKVESYKLVPYYEINEDCTAYHYPGVGSVPLVICKHSHPTLK